MARRICWTDEACFHEMPISIHIWSNNSLQLREYVINYPPSINIWSGIVDNDVVGLYLLPTRLNAGIYEIFLDVPLNNIGGELAFQHGEVPAQFELNNRALNAQFRNDGLGD